MSDTPEPQNSEGNELAQLKEKARETIAEIDQKKATLSALETELSQQAEFAKTQNELLKATAHEVEALRISIGENSASATQSVQIITDARKEIEELANNTRQSIEQLTTMKVDISTKLSDIAEAIKEFNSARAEAQKITAEISQAKTSIEQSQIAATTASEAIERTKDSLSKYDEASKASRENLSTREGEIDQKIAELEISLGTLKTERDALKNIVEEIDKIRTEAADVQTAALSDVQKISETNERFLTLKTQAEQASEELSIKTGNASEKISEIEATYNRIRDQRAELIEDRTAEDGTVQKSIATIIRDKEGELRQAIEQTKSDQSAASSDWATIKATFTTELTELLASSKGDFESLRSRLEREIQELLPGAGAAGLSSAYVDAKAKYGPSKFVYLGSESDSKWWKVFLAWIVYCIQSYATPLFLYAIFLGPLIPVFVYFRDLLDFAKEHPKELTTDLLLLRTAIAVPLLTVSVFGLSSIRLYRRLYEEYNHKQRVMQLYDSFKREFAKVGDEEQQKALLAIMLATVGDKPSLAMHKYDKGTEGLLPTMNFESMFSNIFKTKGSGEGS